ncbi:MAG: SHOCT domain-containing protein [Candidatus Nitrosotenuis sp.]
MIFVTYYLVLKMRLAKGEITKEEYEDLKKMLE